jgi:hypothetical protein
VRCGLTFLAVLAACLSTGTAGATSHALIVGRSTVTALAADGGDVAFAAARTSTDCDRVFIWKRSTQKVSQLGKKQRCDSTSTGRGIAGLAVTGGRALWLSYAGGNIREWRLSTATSSRTTPRLLQFVPRDVSEPQPIIVGAASGGLLPYAVDSTVTTLRAGGGTAFNWTASTPVVALAAADGQVAVAEGGGRVTVLDSQGRVVSVDLYASDVSAVALVAKGQLVQRGAVLEMRHGTEAHEYATAANARLADAAGKWAAWSDGKLVHVLRLTDGVQTATFGGSSAALAGNRLYVANGRSITVRTIR